MQDKKSNWIGLLSFGFFILLFALFFIIVPDYSSKVTDFFKDFELVEIALNFYLPAPLHRHPLVYETVMRFCIIFGFFQFFWCVFIFGELYEKD